ncbi:MAG: hypothetical protein K2F74_04565 [Muribaculaceae bacterium]|nr:hypothetical protein [Muribaculaceae bacterium]MDE5929221.1 hypothetical protein [Muribaculaceae bacterium]MDE6130845.1 hypothetical protein [Muribaculaceae bacterium]
MNSRRTPLWMTVVIVLCALPVFAFPTLLGMLPDESPLAPFVWFYPLYVPAAAVCAWLCYPSRRELSWILLVLMILTHAAFWTAVLYQ